MEQCKKITIQSFQAITQYSCCVRPLSELHQLSEYITRFNVKFTLNAYGFIRYFTKDELYYSTTFLQLLLSFSASGYFGSGMRKHIISLSP